MLKKVLGRKLGGSVMAPQSDTSSLYVLICSLAGTVLEPSRNVDRRFSLFCAADGRLKLFRLHWHL